MRTVILLTGKTFTGKSELATQLQEQFGFKIFRSGEYLEKLFGSHQNGLTTPTILKSKGDELDSETNHRWLFDEVASKIDSDRNHNYVIDNVHSPKQLSYFRERKDWKVIHVHLYCPSQIHLTRFQNSTKYHFTSDYQQVNHLENQNDIIFFKTDADIRINTGRTDKSDNLVRVAAGLKLYPPPDTKSVDVIIGGQYGSEGKGNISAYLAHEYDVVIRVGGPNAGHTVSSSSGVTTYHQLPSGCKDTNAEILLGPGMTINPRQLIEEIKECNLTPERLYIDPQAMIISEQDIAAETGLVNGIGSTGQGGGAAASRRILERNKDTRLAKDEPLLRDYVGESEPYRGSTYQRLEKAYSEKKSILLEGTQGSALSLYHGEYPYVTSRDTNVAGCLAEAGISPSRVRKILMVVRSTPIRVANPEDRTSGGLKHETSFKNIAELSGLDATELLEHEKTSTTKRQRRVGWFDWELFRKAASLNAPTDIVLTFADYIHKRNQSAKRFEQLTEDTIKFVEELERVAQAPVSLISTRFPRDEDNHDLRNIIDRRNWSTRKKVKLYDD